MKKHKRAFFSHANIKQQLYAIYMVAVVVPITLIGTFLLVNTYRLLVDYHRDLLQSDNQRVRNVLFEITSQIYNISENIAFDTELQEVLTGRYGEREWYLDAVDAVKCVDNYENNYPEISEIDVYTDNVYAEDYKQMIRVNSEIRQQDWYQKAVSQSGVFWKEMSWEDKYGNTYWNLCLIRKIPLVNSKYHAVLVMKLSDDYLRTRVDGSEYLNRISVDDGQIFYSSERSLYGTRQIVPIDYALPYYQYMGNARVDDVASFVNVTTLHTYQSESKLYICTIDEQGYARIRNIQSICLMIIILAILIPGLVIHYFTNYFTGRVNVLRQEMHKASNQDYELISSFQGNDELTEAFEDLQVMVQNIKEQEAKVYGAQINQQELLIQQQSMEFKMLSSQINPHFLYNTLETIRMKAFTAGDREVATAIKLLGKSMRYVLENTGTAFTTLAAEIAHVENYIQIQKLRFGDRINFEKQIAEDIVMEQYQILPLLLQPVIENAIIHGLEDNEREGHIVLAVYRRITEQGKMLFIDVQDDGGGMDEERLQELRKNIEHKDMSRSKSIGLYNINQRIKLHYGSEYRIHVYSELHKGTMVRLLLPVDKMRLE